MWIRFLVLGEGRENEKKESSQFVYLWRVRGERERSSLIHVMKIIELKVTTLQTTDETCSFLSSSARSGWRRVCLCIRQNRARTMRRKHCCSHSILSYCLSGKNLKFIFFFVALCTRRAVRISSFSTSKHMSSRYNHFILFSPLFLSWFLWPKQFVCVDILVSKLHHSLHRRSFYGEGKKRKK